MQEFEQPLLPSEEDEISFVEDEPSTSSSAKVNGKSDKSSKSLKRPAPEKIVSKINLADYRVELSPSGRAECVGCRNKIMKGLLRVSKLEYFTEVGMRFNGQAFQHHLECFGVMCKKEYKFYLGGNALPGFSLLNAKDQEKVLKHITAGYDDVIDAKKLKLASNSDPKLEALIESQTQTFQIVRELLKTSSNVKVLSEFLRFNNSKVSSGYENILDRCADLITFGAILKCKTCVKGDLIFAKHGYKCDGELNEWSRCNNFEESPARTLVKFPNSLNSLQSELIVRNIKLSVQNRAVRPRETNLYDPKRDIKVVRTREPLYNMHVVAIPIGKFDKTKLKQRIESMGGKLVTKLQERIAVVISTAEEVEKEKMIKRMKEVRDLKIQVVEESFLDKIEGCSPRDTVDVIIEEDISGWGSDPLSRIPQEENTTELRVSCK